MQNSHIVNTQSRNNCAFTIFLKSMIGYQKTALISDPSQKKSEIKQDADCF